MGRYGCAAMGLLLAATSAQAAQTVSERMADCAGLMQAASDWALYEEDGARMREASDRWLAASVDRARAEGAHYPDFQAVSMQGDAVSAWRAVGPEAAGSEAFRIMAQACRVLDRDLGLGIYTP